MSAQQTPSNLLSQQVAFWDDVTTELNGSRTRRDVPDMPTISVDYQVIKTPGIEGLAYLMLQIQKTQDRAVVIRALASACSILFNDKKNFLGCRTQAVDLKGLEIAENDSTDRGKEIPTNFEDEELITVGELLDTMEADADEVGAYFGVLFLAGNKKVTTDNRPAFNEKRQQAATASLIGPAKIFVPNSPFLTDEILGKIYATFTSLQPLRAHLVSNVVAKLQQPHMGPSLAFTNMFLLLTDSGMNALKIIKEAVVKHPWIRKKFPELRPEFAAANEAQQIIRKGPVQSRPFLKAVHGNTFVPVDYKTIENLTGVCKEVLRRTTPSYNNYGGGKVSEHQLATINAMIEAPDRGTGDALVSE